jgi:hypothetical protein
MSTAGRKSYTRRNARTRIRDLLTEALELVDKHCVSSDTMLTPKTATGVTLGPRKAAKLNIGLTPVQEEEDAEESLSLQATALPPTNSLRTSLPPTNSLTTSLPVANSLSTAAASANNVTATKTKRKYTQSNSRNAGIKLWNEKVTAYLAEQRAQGRKLTRPEAMAELKGKKGAVAPRVSPASARPSPTPGRLSPPSVPLNINRI